MAAKTPASKPTTRSMVREIAYDLVVAGIWPGTNLVHERLGGKGSKRTVSSEFKAWQQEALVLLAQALDSSSHKPEPSEHDTLISRLQAVTAEREELRSRLDESRRSLETAFARFEVFEDRMFAEIEKARGESARKVEALQGELRQTREDFAIAERKWILREQLLVGQISELGHEPAA